MTYYSALLAFLSAFPAYYLEQPDATRPARLEMVAHELAPYPRSVAIPLAYQMQRESGFAAYVWNGCENPPKGAPSCDKGKARGYLQPWEVACRAAYQYAPGTIESLREEVKCGARIWRNGLRRCDGRHPAGNIAGGFSAFAGASCEWPGGAKRATEYEATLQRFLRIRRQP